MGRIAGVFNSLKQQGKKGFIPYITAGDPDLATTEELLVTLSQSATLIELGVPFSDPMADGPVIQRASERALKHNFSLQKLLDTAARARKRTGVPIILFSYYNPLASVWFEARRASRKRCRDRRCSGYRSHAGRVRRV